MSDLKRWAKNMWPFSLFKKGSPPTLPCPAKTEPTKSNLDDFRAKDYMGKGIQLGHNGKAAIKERRFDDAWRLFHEQKEEYRKHAARYGMTARQAMALDASVHEDLANIRRLEGKHEDALVHLLYCVFSSSRPTKAQEKKISAYFERCEFKSSGDKELRKLKDDMQPTPDFIAIRNTIARWASKK